MLSNTLEIFGFAALTASAYEFSGRALALLTLAAALFTMGLAVEGVHPLLWLRARARTRWQSLKAARAARQRTRGITSPT